MNNVLRGQLRTLQQRLAELEHQLEWFKRQLFGQKSEQLRTLDPAMQPSLLASLVKDTPPLAPVVTETRTFERRQKRRDDCVNDTGLRFDASVPVRVIEVPPPAGMDGDIIATHSTLSLPNVAR